MTNRKKKVVDDLEEVAEIPKELLATLEEQDDAAYPEIPDAPWALSKATVDQFTYLAIFRNGWKVEFEEAEVDRDNRWVTLKGIHRVREFYGCVLPEDLKSYYLERGLCVRISEIIAVVDAPHGS